MKSPDPGEPFTNFLASTCCLSKARSNSIFSTLRFHASRISPDSFSSSSRESTVFCSEIPIAPLTLAVARSVFSFQMSKEITRFRLWLVIPASTSWFLRRYISVSGFMLPSTAAPSSSVYLLVDSRLLSSKGRLTLLARIYKRDKEKILLLGKSGHRTCVGPRF